MSGFEPGDGWREVTGTSDMDEATLVDYENHPERGWVREAPVPPLPTEPWTTIKAKWREGGHTFLVLTPIGWQDVDGNALRSGGGRDLAALIEGFAVLSEPRAVTAEAVLDRVHEEIDDGIYRAWLDTIAREFGVSS